MIWNVIETLACTGLVLIFIMLILLLLKPQKLKHDYAIIASILIILVLTLLDVIESESLASTFIYDTVQVLLGPALYLYVLGVRGISHRKITLSFHAIVPLLNCTIGIVVIWEGWSVDDYEESLLVYAVSFVNFLSILTYGVLMIISYFQYKWKDQGFLSNPVKWSGTLIVTYLITTIVNFCYLFIYSIGTDEDWIWLLDAIISLLLVLVIVGDGMRLGILYQRKQHVVELEDQERWLSIFDRVDKKIKTESLFLNPQLRIEDLAQLISTNGRYISKAVNVGYGDSVTNYLNALRLDLFKQKLRDSGNHQLTIDALAMECGFNSKSTANRFFKAQEGMTPSAYRDSIL